LRDKPRKHYAAFPQKRKNITRNFSSLIAGTTVFHSIYYSRTHWHRLRESACQQFDQAAYKARPDAERHKKTINSAEQTGKRFLLFCLFIVERIKIFI
jgi:hypothetical protein